MHRLALLASLLLALAITGCAAPVRPTPTPLPPTPTPVPQGAPAVQVADRTRLAAWASAWEAVERFRAEITVIDQSGRVQQRVQLAVVLPDRLHAFQLDPATGQPTLEWIVIGDAGWIKQGDRWQLGQIRGPLDLAQLYDPSSLAEARDASAGGATVTMEELAPERLDGVPCQRWSITVTPVGQATNRITLWLGQDDQLPRQLRTEYPDGSVLLLRYCDFGEAIEIQPPAER